MSLLLMLSRKAIRSSPQDRIVMGLGKNVSLVSVFWFQKAIRFIHVKNQNSALPGVRANGMTSRMFDTPVMNMSIRSNPRPKPECGTVP
jgi:hypothetical protein